MTSDQCSAKNRPSLISSSDKIFEGYGAEDTTQDPRLLNYRRWLELRKQTTSKLGMSLGRKSECLVMNSTEDTRYVNEEKQIFQQTNAYIEPDKYRGSPYDWLPPILLSNKGKPNLPDCEVTRTNLEKGIISDLNYVDTPTIIRKEKLLHGCIERPSVKETWDKSHYVQKRLEDTHKIRKHRPKMSDLIIKGEGVEERMKHQRLNAAIPVLTVSDSSDFFETEEHSPSTAPLNDDPAQNLRNPCLHVQATKFSKKVRRVSYSTERSLTILREDSENEIREFSLQFEAKLNEKSNKYIKLENPGSIKLTYRWRQKIHSGVFSDIPKMWTFSNFFFNKGGGVLMPGKNLDIPVWFHSRKHGIFEEYWELIVVPKVTTSLQNIVFRFWGIAIDETSTDLEHNKIESYINMRVSESQVRAATHDLFVRTRYPNIPPEGDKIRYLDEKSFLQKNPEYYYHPSVVQSLANLYKEVLRDANAEWNFDIRLLRHLIIRDTGDPVKQQERLNLLCKSLKTLLSPCHIPSYTNTKHMNVRNILGSFINNMENHADKLKTQFSYGALKSVSQTPPGIEDRISPEFQKSSTEKLRRISQLKNFKGRKKNSESGSRLGVTSKSSDVSSLDKSSGSMKDSQGSFATDKIKYAMYKEALFVNVYHHLGTAVEQISSVLDSMKAVE